MDQQKVEAIKTVLRERLLPDCLKPEYDGMSLHELAETILKAIEP